MGWENSRERRYLLNDDITKWWKFFVPCHQDAINHFKKHVKKIEN